MANRHRHGAIRAQREFQHILLLGVVIHTLQRQRRQQRTQDKGVAGQGEIVQPIFYGAVGISEDASNNVVAINRIDSIVDSIVNL